MGNASNDTLPAVGDIEKEASSRQSDDMKKSEVELQDGSDPYLVDSLDADEDPKNFPFSKKVVIMIVMSVGALCSTFCSSIAAFAEAGEARDFNVSKQVTILGVTLYVVGIAFGPLLVGPLSEVYGRSIIYRVSYSLFFAFSWPVAFPPDISVFLIFRFFTGFCSSAFLSVSGGTVSDIFTPQRTAVPVALYTLSPFFGPMLGPLVSGFINQNLDWRWTYRVALIWVFVETLLIFLVVPETYQPALLKAKAKKLRKATGDQRYYAPLDKRVGSLTRSIIVSCYRPFELLALDRMNLLLDLWTAILFGILYLAFQAFPYIFVVKHGFTLQETGMAFIGIGVGMVFGCATNVWLIIRTQRIHNDNPPPEARLLTGQVGAVMVPLSLYWLAFTTYPQVHWIAPIIASSFFGAGFLLCFSSTFTYLVSAYRPMAASAMAANAFVRSAFAGAFPLFAGQMYERLGTVGATALLAGVMTLAAPLPFVFAHIGARLREKSPFATH